MLVATVVWWMWRLPATENAYYGWAPPLALGSAWLGLIALAAGAAMWVLPYPDILITVCFLAIDPAAICMGTLVLWIYRRDESALETVQQQRLQARIGVVLGLLAVVVGYSFVFAHKAPGSAVGF